MVRRRRRTDHCDWAFAVSADGSHFVKKGQISHLGNVEDDHVVHDTAKVPSTACTTGTAAHEPLGLFCATSKDETDFDFGHAASLRSKGETYPGMYKFSHVFLEGGAWYMYYGNFVRPHCPDGTVRFATSSDGLHWTCRNKDLLKGHDGEVLKVADRLYIMYYGPQGYFDRRGCDIRAAVYAGDLNYLANIEERGEEIDCGSIPTDISGITIRLNLNETAWHLTVLYDHPAKRSRPNHTDVPRDGTGRSLAGAGSYPKPYLHLTGGKGGSNL